MIVKRNELVKTYLEQYKTLVDNLYIYDTSDNKFTLQSNYQRAFKFVKCQNHGAFAILTERKTAKNKKAL